MIPLDEFHAADPAAWRAAAEESLKGAPFEKKLLTRTPEGITLRPIYTKEDLKGGALAGTWPGLDTLGRGNPPGPTRPLVAQAIPFGLPAVFNEAARADIARGQDALMIRLDAAGRRGVDPSEAGTAEVATTGLSLACLEDMREALEGIDPERTRIFLWAGATGLPLTALLAARSESWRGGVLGDPLTEYVRRGDLPVALDDAYTEMAACASWSLEQGSRLRTIGVEASLWADAGASAVEETAFAVATAAEYLREMTAQGISVADFADQILFSFALGTDVLMQTAKIRAARILWSNILAACGVEPRPAHVHARSAHFHRSGLDPHTNMLRATVEGFAGCVAGVESLELSPFDATVRTPDAFSRRIARNIHVILAEECGFAATADAAGGSWAVETLTSELAAKAWALFQAVEAKGGMAAALREGFPQGLVAETRKGRLEALATRRKGLIGVNLFPNPAEEPLGGGETTDARAIHAERAARIEALRPTLLSKTERSVEAVRDAFASGATLGQVSEALPRSAPCEPEIKTIPSLRAPEGYEALRARAQREKARQGRAPQAWLANFGPPKQHKARADFAAGFLGAGGFEARQGEGAATPEGAAKAALKSKAPVVVICSTDETYPEIVPPFAKAVHAARPGTLILLAGYPKEHVAAFKAAGVHDFIHLRADCLALLEALQNDLSIGT